MTPSPTDPQIWAALHDIEGWSLTETPHEVQLHHVHGTRILALPTLSGPRSQVHYSLRIGESQYLIGILLNAPRMTLPLWRQVVAPLHHRRTVRLGAMMRSLLLRENPTVQGLWRGHHDRDHNVLWFYSRGEEPQTGPDGHVLRVELQVPDWMQAPGVPIVQWIDLFRRPEIQADYAVCQMLDLSASAHQRIEDLRHASLMPDFQDPACATYWGLG